MVSKNPLGRFLLMIDRSFVIVGILSVGRALIYSSTESRLDFKM
jgi:hypothetical protein